MNISTNDTNSQLPIPISSIQIITFMISGLELTLIHPIAIATSVFSFALLTSTKLLHANLKCILLCQSLSILAGEICRIIYVTLKFLNWDMFYDKAYPIQAIALTATNCRNLLIHALLIERLMATFYYRKYERWQKPYFGLVSVVILLFFSIWLTISQQGSPWSVTSGTIVALAVLTAYDFVQILIVVCLYFYNHHNYQSGIALKLDHKFQLSENIRTARQLTPSFIFHFVNICTNNGISLLIFFKLVENRSSISLCFMVGAIVNGIVNFIIELSVITHHPILRRKALGWLHAAQNLLRGNKVDAVGHASRYIVEGTFRDIRGRQLINVPEQEKHFNMLRDCWR